MDLEFMTNNALASGGIEPGNLTPIQFRDHFCDRLALDIGLPTEQAAYRLIEVKNMAGFVDDEHTILNRIEEGFEKRTFSRQALDNVLQALGIKAPNPIEDFVEEV